MANPTHRSWKRLKKAARYLKGAEKVTWAMRAWKHHEMRKSTSGGMMMMINGTVAKTLVENTSDACAEHGKS